MCVCGGGGGDNSKHSTNSIHFMYWCIVPPPIQICFLHLCTVITSSSVDLCSNYIHCAASIYTTHYISICAVTVMTTM